MQSFCKWDRTESPTDYFLNRKFWFSIIGSAIIRPWKSEAKFKLCCFLGAMQTFYKTTVFKGLKLEMKIFDYL